MPSPEARYDLTIIGSGPGGYVAAVRAAQLGLKTAVVEMAPAVGGTCLQWGCIPTKALLQTAEVLETARHAAKFGVKVQGAELDMGAVHKFKDKVVGSNTRGVEFLFKKNGVTLLQGRGRLAGRGRVEVTPKSGAPSVVESKTVVLATGSAIRGLPGVEFDGERIINSDHALGLRTVPASMIVLGGGAVGVEFASIYASFGGEGHRRRAPPAPAADRGRGARRRARKSICEARNRSAHGHARRAREAGRARGLRRCHEEGCAGRARSRNPPRGRRPSAAHRKSRPRRDGGCARPRLRRNGRHDAHRRAGRLRDRRHRQDPRSRARGLARRDRRRRACGGAEPPAGQLRPHPLVHLLPARGRLDRPQRGGGPPARLRRRRGLVSVQRERKAKILDDTRGFVRIVAEKKRDEVLGVQIIGPHATELLAEATAALALEATAESILEAVHAHPTLSEAMGEAALAVHGRSIHI